MKIIILFRHGQAHWNSGFNKDYERTLTDVGILEAEKMGRYLANKNLIPEQVISSSAIRAHTTAKTANIAGKWNKNIILEPMIYGGNPEFLLNLVKSQDDKINFICLVGHEPNFSGFVNKSIIGNFRESYPTATMAKIDFEIEKWDDIEFNTGNLDWAVRPYEIK